MLLCTAKQQSDQRTGTSAKQKKLNRQNQSLPAVCPSLNWAGYTNLLCRGAAPRVTPQQATLVDGHTVHAPRPGILLDKK